jgi:hypothetical protein
MLKDRRDIINGVKRRPVTRARDCPLVVIMCKNLEWADHLVKLVDFSVIGVGIESDRPIEPGIIWFKESIYGQKCGSLVWCKKIGLRYRAGIQFLSFTRDQEEYLRHQIEQLQRDNKLHDPERFIAKLIDEIKKNTDGPVSAV